MQWIGERASMTARKDQTSLEELSLLTGIDRQKPLE
jgi:hypothetical protein